MGRSNKRKLILEAASRIVMSRGSKALTLDAVAEEAGVSKGGLLYHYPNKRLLISGMVQNIIDRFESILGESDNPDFILSYVISATNVESKDHETAAGLLAALTEDSTLLDPLREHLSRWIKSSLANASDPTLATVVVLAADGLWYNDFMNLNMITPQQRADAVARIFELALQSTK